MEDRKGLDRAYSLNSGSYLPQGNTLYVAGTKSARDIWDDLKIPFYLTSWSDWYQEADRVLDAWPQVNRIVGHPLGGAVALELAKNHPKRNLETETYGAPSSASPGARIVIGTTSTRSRRSTPALRRRFPRAPTRTRSRPEKGATD